MHMLRSLLLLAAAAAAPSWGQSSAGGGSIQGTVKDISGAAVPRAKVGIRGVDTGVAHNTVSNEDGYFSTPPINIGRYKVRVEAPGMKAWEEEILLETGKTVEVTAVAAGA